MPESVSLEIGGRTLIIETGELAKQANGSVLVRYGDANVVLCRRHRLGATPRQASISFPSPANSKRRCTLPARSRAATSSAKAVRPSTAR